jgi:hypothetical protein
MRDVSGIMQEPGVYKDRHFSVFFVCVLRKVILIDCSENHFTLLLIYPTKLHQRENSNRVRQG